MSKFKEDIKNTTISSLQFRKQSIEDEIERLKERIAESESNLKDIEELLAEKSEVKTVNVLKIKKGRNYKSQVELRLMVCSVEEDDDSQTVDKLEAKYISWTDRASLPLHLSYFKEKYNIKKIITFLYQPTKAIEKEYEVIDATLNDKYRFD